MDVPHAGTPHDEQSGPAKSRPLGHRSRSTETANLKPGMCGMSSIGVFVGFHKRSHAITDPRYTNPAGPRKFMERFSNSQS